MHYNNNNINRLNEQLCQYKSQGLPLQNLPDRQQQQAIDIRDLEKWRLTLTWTRLHSQDQPSSPVKEERQNQPRLLLSGE